MSAAMTRAPNPSVLLPYLDGTLVNYDVHPQQWHPVFEIREADKAVMTIMEFAGTERAREKFEASPAFQSSGGQRYQTKAVNLTYAIYFSMSNELIDDNLYLEQWPREAEMLRASCDDTKNANAMILFNNAFNMGSALGDGQPMCSLNHPLDVGVNANTFNTGYQMNEDALEDMLTLADSWENVNNLRIERTGEFLLVPPALIFQASRLLDSKFQPETGNNAINAIEFNKFLPKGFKKNNYLAYNNRFFMITNQKGGFIHYRKQKLQIAYDSNIISNVLNGRAFERYANVCTTYRAVVGAGTGIQAV